MTGFNDDDLNDDGYPNNQDCDIRDEWLNEEQDYWSESELDPADSSNYDAVDSSDNCGAADEWGDDETAIGLDYDGYNDPENY